LDILYRFAKFQFDCGNYADAANYLHYYRDLTNPSSEKHFLALWGKFAADILMQNWDAALEDMNALRESIDTKVSSEPLSSFFY
jgi:translation initiation factor 3 subunit E